MSEEPRRSGRATKGQYTKDRDIDDDGSKKKGKAKGSKSSAPQTTEEEGEEGQEEEIIRCICGQYEEEEDTQRDMICCDKCSAWQHNDCMLLPYPPEGAPDQYYCEQCKPGDHKHLLAAIAKGEKPWEEVARRREAAEAEKASKKKRGPKGGRKSGPRPGEPLPEPVAVSNSTQTPSKEEGGGRDAASSSAGQKRKHEEPSNGGGTPQDIKKQRPIPSSAVASPVDAQNGAHHATQGAKPNVMPSPVLTEAKSKVPPGPVTNVEALPMQRRPIAASLVKLLSSEATAAQTQGKYVPPENQTVAEMATLVGLSVEYALYQILCHGSGDPNNAYKAQARTILFNLKKNDALRDSLLNGNLTATTLAKMSPEHMASKEQQSRDAKIKQDQEKQHVIIQEQGPRIRRTHKGEEYVDETQQVAAEPDIMNAPVRRRESGLGQDTEATRRLSGGVKANNQRSADDRVLSINTQALPRPPTEPERKSSQAFNIQDVWSSIHGSPDADRQVFPQIPYQSGGQPQKANQTEADPDIDALLKDEGVESPPYSPKSFDGDKMIIWQGSVNMNAVARFQALAKKAAGADVENLGLTWQQVIPDVLSIDGRIDPARADSYLCGLRYSSTSDVIVVSLTASDNSNDRQQFRNLFHYLQSRNRYGVGASSANPAVKDIYLIPLEAGSEKKPELLQLLDNDQIETPIPEDILLVPFVVKTSELNMAATPKEQVTMAASPIGIVTPGASVPTAPPPAQSGMPTLTPPPASHLATQNPATMHYPAQQPYLHHSPTLPPPATHATASAPSQASPSSIIRTSPSATTTTTTTITTNPTANPPPPQAPPPPSTAPSQAQVPDLTGHDAAAYILGPQAASQMPALQQLLTQAPHVGIMEMGVVAQCLEENPAARSELSVLTAMLVEKQKGVK